MDAREVIRSALLSLLAPTLPSEETKRRMNTYADAILSALLASGHIEKEGEKTIRMDIEMGVGPTLPSKDR